MFSNTFWAPTLPSMLQYSETVHCLKLLILKYLNEKQDMNSRNNQILSFELGFVHVTVPERALDSFFVKQKAILDDL